MLFLAAPSVHWLASFCLVFLFVFPGYTKDAKEDTLELRFEYNDSGTWNGIILYPNQVISQSF